MSLAPQSLSRINLQGRRKREFTTYLRAIHSAKPKTRPASRVGSEGAIQVVCISDTHNTRPVLPPGDVLIHAGDLTENGSFDEIQAGLLWLSSQPHRYKILTAGNHDVLLDDAFLAKYPERRYGQAKTKEDLNWGDVLYLQDASVTLNFPPSSNEHNDDHSGESSKLPRKLTIFGSPWTPQYGISAFQYRPDDIDHWASRFAALRNPKPDIVVTHGPPKHHLDTRDVHRAGCAYLAQEISQLRPRLVVFGHIHASYGREDIVLDRVQKVYEDVMTGWAGWAEIGWMAVLVMWARLTKPLFRVLGTRKDGITTFVNASIVGGPNNELRNQPVVVEL